MAPASSMTADVAVDIPTLLRFLTKTASLPLALAMSKIPSLRALNLTSSAAIASAPFKRIKEEVFPEDEKMAKKLHAAAKREAKKRMVGDDDGPGPIPNESSKRRKKNGFGDAEGGGDSIHDEAAELENDLSLPSFSSYFPTHTTDSDIISLLNATTLVTNRAPLLLAFTLVLLQFTMPEQPLSSRLSLAQCVVSEGARKRAKDLGIVTAEGAAKAEEEGWGTGQRGVRVMGRTVRVMKRGISSGNSIDHDAQKESRNDDKNNASADSPTETAENGEAPHGLESTEEPALWALDLEALKSSNTVTFSSSTSTSSTSNLPIHQPHGARNYLLKSFATPTTSSPPPFTAPSSSTSKAKKAAKAQTETQVKAANLALLLKALETLFASWAMVLSREDLDRRAWGFYVQVRPDVEEGKAGWGGKGEVKLGRILELRRGGGDGRSEEEVERKGVDVKVLEEEGKDCAAMS